MIDGIVQRSEGEYYKATMAIEIKRREEKRGTDIL